MHPEYEAVIGLEVHCQLATQTKIFCSCPARMPDGKSVADVEANANSCPVCAGHPGTLPVLNQRVVEFAIKAGLATNCQIRTQSVFARKNYFYPDLPKGYQISQFDKPICENGWLTIETRSGSKKVNIQRIHMEEDAGKNIHMSGYSLVNLNRAGVPLIEIVSGPEMSSSEEAVAYLRNLHAIVTYLGITDGNMQEGNFRCDANVSVKPVKAKELGTRVEIKNVNSFKFIEKAIDFEIARQIEVVRSGGRIVQETRTFDSARSVTSTMRSKEEAQDYRYFPDPDLVPVTFLPTWVEEIRQNLPELPEQKRNRLIQDVGLSAYDAGVLTGSRSLVLYFEEVIQVLVQRGMDLKMVGKPAANWVTGEIVRLMNEEGIEIENARIKPSHLADIIQLVLKQVLSSTGAKQVISLIWKTGETVEAVVDREGLRQVSNTDALEPVIDKIIATYPGQVTEYRSGKEKLIGFFVGQAMKEMSGKANPALLGELFKKKLSKS